MIFHVPSTVLFDIGNQLLQQQFIFFLRKPDVEKQFLLQQLEHLNQLIYVFGQDATNDQIVQSGNFVLRQSLVAFFPHFFVRRFTKFVSFLAQDREYFCEFLSCQLELAVKQNVYAGVKVELLSLVGEYPDSLTADKRSSVRLSILNVLAHLA
jgi:hypothetical protein